MDPYSSVLSSISQARDGNRIRPTMSLYKLPLGMELPCEQCGATVTLKEIRSTTSVSLPPLRCWSDCGCTGKRIDIDTALSIASGAYQAAQRVEVIPDPVPIARFTFETFDPERLAAGVNLYDKVLGWMQAIEALAVAPGFHHKPRACVYFHSPVKGCGKTHLAGALVNYARASGKSAVMVDEISYIETYWAAKLEDRKRLSDLPGRRAWLTVIDDLGQRENTTPGLRDAWYSVFNPRWLGRGFTIITSNYKPDELLARGTINEATHSRIGDMTQGRVLTFEGVDQRLIWRDA